MTKTSKPNNRGLIFMLGAFLVVAVVVFAVANTTQDGQVQAEPGLMAKMTGAQAEQWVQGKELAFVEFFSPECSACMIAEPVLTKLVAEKELNFAAVDVRYPENRELMAKLGVNATPTIVVYSNGRVVEAPVVGFIGEPAYRDFFDAMIAKYSGS